MMKPLLKLGQLDDNLLFKPVTAFYLDEVDFTFDTYSPLNCSAVIPATDLDDWLGYVELSDNDVLFRGIIDNWEIREDGARVTAIGPSLALQRLPFSWEHGTIQMTKFMDIVKNYIPILSYENTYIQNVYLSKEALGSKSFWDCLIATFQNNGYTFYFTPEGTLKCIPLDQVARYRVAKGYMKELSHSYKPYEGVNVLAMQFESWLANYQCSDNLAFRPYSNGFGGVPDPPLGFLDGWKSASQSSLNREVSLGAGFRLGVLGANYLPYFINDGTWNYNYPAKWDDVNNLYSKYSANARKMKVAVLVDGYASSGSNTAEVGIACYDANGSVIGYNTTTWNYAGLVFLTFETTVNWQPPSGTVYLGICLKVSGAGATRGHIYWAYFGVGTSFPNFSSDLSGEVNVDLRKITPIPQISSADEFNFISNNISRFFNEHFAPKEEVTLTRIIKSPANYVNMMGNSVVEYEGKEWGLANGSMRFAGEGWNIEITLQRGGRELIDGVTGTYGRHQSAFDSRLHPLQLSDFWRFRR